MSLWARTKQGVANVFKAPRSLNSVQNSRGYSWLHDFGGTGYWQQDITIDRDTVLSNWAVFSCMTLIASDIGKVSLKLMEDRDGIWIPTESPAFSPVIRKPNGYQTRQQFIESWVMSKLGHGNAYVLKERDMRGVVVAQHVLDPTRVYPLVAQDGSVYYQLMQDDLAKVGVELVAVPASEIIHDRMNCFFHPLVGLSPIFASGLSATQGIHIQKNSTKFFENMSRPSGILTAPGSISNETADRLKAAWETNYSGSKIGKTAVLGDDLKYQSMAVTAADAQMIEQLKFSAEMICSTFHVPAFKIGAGSIPAGQKVEDLNQIYYSDCLHALMDAIQTLQTYGLGLDTPTGGRQLAVHFDLHDLLKMDGRTLAEVEGIKVQRGISSPNESRRMFNLAAVPGGDQPYLQQQNYSLEALAKRDAQADPFGTAAAAAPAVTPPAAPEDSAAEEMMAFVSSITKGLAEITHA